MKLIGPLSLTWWQNKGHMSGLAWLSNNEKDYAHLQIKFSTHILFMHILQKGIVCRLHNQLAIYAKYQKLYDCHPQLNIFVCVL